MTKYKRYKDKEFNPPKEFVVTMSISGSCSVFVEAETKEDAQRLAETGLIDRYELDHWSFEDVIEVYEND